MKNLELLTKNKLSVEMNNIYKYKEHKINKDFKVVKEERLPSIFIGKEGEVYWQQILLQIQGDKRRQILPQFQGDYRRQIFLDSI
jgi:hypothetical protein